MTTFGFNRSCRVAVAVCWLGGLLGVLSTLAGCVAGDVAPAEGAVQQLVPGVLSDEGADSCRALVWRGERLALTSPSGAEVLLHRESRGEVHERDLAAIGEYAVVGVAPPDWAGESSVVLLHSGAGVVWRGTSARLSDYTPAVGFVELSRQGFLVLSDERVVDGDGVVHAIPAAGYSLLDGHVDDAGNGLLVGERGALAYWNVRGDELTTLDERGLGPALTPPVTIGDAAAFLQRRDGAVQLVTVASSSERVLSLSSALGSLIAERIDDDWAVEWRHADGEIAAALLLVSGHPVALVREGQQALEFEGARAWQHEGERPELYVSGAFFMGVDTFTADAEEFLRAMCRIDADSGRFETGLRQPLPAGLSLVLPTDGLFQAPAFHGGGRIAVLLRGPDGVAWFTEGEEALERLTPWSVEYGQPLPELEPEAQTPPSRVRSWWRADPTYALDQRCELLREGPWGSDAEVWSLIDHQSGATHVVAHPAHVVWFGQ